MGIRVRVGLDHPPCRLEFGVGLTNRLMRSEYMYTAPPVVRTEEFLQCVQSGFLIKEDNLGSNQVRALLHFIFIFIFYFW